MILDRTLFKANNYISANYIHASLMHGENASLAKIDKMIKFKYIKDIMIISNTKDSQNI